MAVTLNAKGTSVSNFQIGKKGTTLYQGVSIDPNTVPEGNFYFDTLLGALKYKGSEPTTWKNLVFDDISFLNNSIISISGEASISLNGDIVLTSGTGGNVLIGADRIFTEADNGTFDAATLGGSPASNYLQSSVNIIAGNGLTGGGDLSQDKTLTVGPGDGIIVNADDVAVDTTVARLNNSAQQTFIGDIIVVGNLTVQGNTNLDQNQIIKEQESKINSLQLQIDKIMTMLP